MTTLRHSVRLGLAAALLLAGLVPAQSAPFAQGPQHPMTAPLADDHPDARLPEELLSVPPIENPALNLAPVTDNRIVEHDPIVGRTVFPPLASDTAGLPGAGSVPGLAPVAPESASSPFVGSIDSFEDEPQNTNVIIGADNRVVISNASSYPWRANAKIFMTFPNGAQRVGSCTIVNRKYALTAGHCVYSAQFGGWARSIRIVPGQSGSSTPYGSAWVTRMRTYTGWTQSGNNQYDIAMITLDRNIGSTVGWFGFQGGANLNGVTANLSAYDADRAPNFQKYRTDRINDTFPLSTLPVVFHYYDTTGGSSGGGVYRFLNGGRYVISVNNWQYSSVNMSVRITSGRANDFIRWINTGY